MESRTTRHPLIIFLSILVLSLSACASTPSSSDTVGAGGDSVGVTILSHADIQSQYGRTPSDDPFLLGSHTLFGKGYDYIVLQITAVSAAGASLEILQAEAQDANGHTKAPFYKKKDFAELANNMSYDPMNISVRQNKISWYYLPSERMHLDRGKSTYVLVLIGSHPLPPSLVVNVRLLLNGVEQDFSLPVPDEDEGSD